jgi:phthiodiolone/phenolphthiodiolone dimycocerosates ketoreductase
MELGVAGQYTFPAASVGRRATAAEQSRWSSLWWPDAQMGYHPSPGQDAANPHETYDWGPMMGAAASHTERIRLGVAVTDPFRHHPLLLAQTAQTLHDLSTGRFVLGIGLGALNNLQPMGLRGSSRISVLEEAIDIMRLLWSTQEPVSFHGETWDLDGAVLGLDSARCGEPEIWLGGAGAKSLSLTGRKGSGWIPVMMPPDVYTERLRELRRVAKEHGRDRGDIVAGCLFLTIAAETEEGARQLLDTPWVRALALFQPAAFFERFGFEHPLGTGSAGVRDFVPTSVSLAQYLDLVKDIPLELVEKLVLWGDAARIVGELASYADAGVEHAVIWNVTGMGEGSGASVRESYRVLDDVKTEFT